MSGYPPSYFGKEGRRRLPSLRELREFARELRRNRILVALLLALVATGVAGAAPALLSNIISTNITVEEPQQVSITLASFPSTITRGINYTFSIGVDNANPALPARWVMNFSRADGVQLNDFEIYMITGTETIALQKSLVDGKLMFTSQQFSLPTGTATYDFIMRSNRAGSYSVAIALTD